MLHLPLRSSSNPAFTPCACHRHLDATDASSVKGALLSKFERIMSHASGSMRTSSRSRLQPPGSRCAGLLSTLVLRFLLLIVFVLFCLLLLIVAVCCCCIVAVYLADIVRRKRGPRIMLVPRFVLFSSGLLLTVAHTRCDLKAMDEREDIDGE